MAQAPDILGFINQQKQSRTQGLKNLGNSVAGILQQKAQKEKIAAGQASQAEAARFLDLSSQGGEEGEANFRKAVAANKDFVLAVMQGQKLRAQAGTEADKVGLRRDEAVIRRQELEDRQAERKLKKEALGLKNIQTTKKIEVAERDAAKEKAGIAAGIDSSLDLVTRMLDDKGLNSAVGLKSILPSIPGSSASDFEALHEQLSGQNFLQSVKQMTGMGSLSDAEGKKLAAAAEALSLDQSPTAYRAALTRIKTGLATRREAGFYNNKDSEATPVATDTEAAVLSPSASKYLGGQ
tara:strand:+ start:730 stop:1614 length:885 start_codon:yes stop_codon:yes gene_type:complete